MSPNLSFEHLAVILALAGCSKATPAADTSTTVRSDPSASAQVEQQQSATPAPQAVTATAAPVTGGRAGGPGGAAASANELRRKNDTHMANPTGQASCGAGSCTSEIKKK